MNGLHDNETAQQTAPKGDIDELIFCAESGWLVSQR